MSSSWRSYLQRSAEHLRNRTNEGQYDPQSCTNVLYHRAARDGTACADVVSPSIRFYAPTRASTWVTVLRASPVPETRTVLPIVQLRTVEDLQQFALGCDEDLGGKSTVHLDLGPEGKGRLWGRLSSELQSGRRKAGVIERGGYAGFRTKASDGETQPKSTLRTDASWGQRTTMFGSQFWDTSLHDFLRLRVRSSGDGMRYFVNIQTDGPVRSDLFQHRLWLPSPSSPEAPHEFTNVLIPFSDFTLTNSGDLSEKQIEMMRTKVRTIGISVLGPKEGRYELGIESIDAVSSDIAKEERELQQQQASATSN
ncbi:hypothetical protein OIO90_003194 [Microbotryomycetes sp. JL221]|nr:hypothetical protein OIO90_003194 [Microbotryomycetes sp. JL221]